jgi:hypothetical protein
MWDSPFDGGSFAAHCSARLGTQIKAPEKKLLPQNWHCNVLQRVQLVFCVEFPRFLVLMAVVVVPPCNAFGSLSKRPKTDRRKHMHAIEQSEKVSH